MLLRPKMQSIWDEIFCLGADHYDSSIEDVLVNSKTLDDQYVPHGAIGTLEILITIFPFDKNDVEGDPINRMIAAQDAYVFGFPRRELLVGQALKSLHVYPDIVRFDMVTTGSLLRFECESYTIEDCT